MQLLHPQVKSSILYVYCLFWETADEGAAARGLGLDVTADGFANITDSLHQMYVFQLNKIIEINSSTSIT